MFFGSKAWASKKTQVCGVSAVHVSEFSLRGFCFYPSAGTGPALQWFPNGIAHALHGKLRFAFPESERSGWMHAFCVLVVFFAKLIPAFLLPSVPHTVLDPPGGVPNEPLPLVIWSHGRGGNVSDHALLCSQFAVEVPALVCAITHTDGSADCFQSEVVGKHYYYQPSLASRREHEAGISELVAMKEYQVDLRVREIEAVIAHLKFRGIKFGKIIVAGFDLGGATALALAAKTPELVAACISLDGTFCIEDKLPFPKALFAKPLQVPVAFLLSDEWDVWNKPVTNNTRVLMEAVASEESKLITVKQTNHFNFVEVMFWVPKLLVSTLRFTGLIHRRGDPRKTYRRTAKWLIALVQQYSGETKLPASSDSEL